MVIVADGSSSSSNTIGCAGVCFKLHLYSFLNPTKHLQMCSLSEQEIRRRLKAVKLRRPAGPDCIPGAVIKAWLNQLAGILTTLFNLSLIHAMFPTCLKTCTIIPIPKKIGTDSLYDCRPLALRSVLMKCYEQIVSQHIRESLLRSLDPYQFADRANLFTEH